MWILNWGITPGGERGRGELPVEVVTWLPAVSLAIGQAQKEAKASDTG